MTGARATVPVLVPQFRLLASGITMSSASTVPLCPYRPFVSVVLDGTAYFFNGWNRPFYADLSVGKLFPLGSTAPTTFAVADAGSGTAFATAHSRFYYLCFRNEDRLEETAPQETAGVAGFTDVIGTGPTDRTITWVDPGDGRWTHAAIYVRRPNSDDIVKLAYVAIAAQTYTDNTVDANLSTAITDTYVFRWRNGYPPVFQSASVHLGRMVAVTGKDANLYYFQTNHPTGEFTQSDLPSGNVLAIEPDDGLGPCVAVFAHYDATIIVKRRGLYLLEDDWEPLPVVRRMFEGRGILGPRAWTTAHSIFVMQDELGPYGWSPGAQPQVLGVKGSGVASSPLAPTWLRLNRDAAAMVHLNHKERLGYVECRMPSDRDSIPWQRVRWNLEENRFESVDTVVSLAAGTLEDRSGLLHDLHLDDLGFMHEEDIGVTDGVTAGDVHATHALRNPDDVTIFKQIACVNAAWGSDPMTGPDGSLCEVRNGTTGALLETNRVLRRVSNPIVEVMYWSPISVDSSQTFDVGVIPADAEFPHLRVGLGKRMTVQRLVLDVNLQSAIYGITPTLNVFTAPDERAFTLKRAIDLTGSDAWAAVPCWDRGFRLKVRLEAHRAGDHFNVNGIAADLWSVRGRR